VHGRHAGPVDGQAVPRASTFVDSGHEETHCCNYLLATDIEMATPDGYASTSWEKGYGDYVMKPDLSTLRPVPWLEGTAMVLCDLIDHHTHEPVPHMRRAQILKKRRLRAEGHGLDADDGNRTGVLPVREELR
jgi:glutamine synthetase